MTEDEAKVIGCRAMKAPGWQFLNRMRLTTGGEGIPGLSGQAIRVGVMGYQPPGWGHTVRWPDFRDPETLEGLRCLAGGIPGDAEELVAALELGTYRAPIRLDATAVNGTLHMHGPWGTLSLWRMWDRGAKRDVWRIWRVPVGQREQTADLMPEMPDRAEAVRAFFRLVGDWAAAAAMANERCGGR